MLRKYDLLFQSAGEAIFMMDYRGYITFCNQMATTITGYTENELLNKPFYIFNDNPDDVIRGAHDLSLALKQGKFVSESWKTRKNKGRYWGELTLSPVFEENNIHVGFCGILRDISEKKQNELRLRESEERFRLMVEGVRDYSIFLLDKEGYIITWNDGGQYINGYLSSEIIGKHFSVFYTSDDLISKKPERELQIAVKTGKYEEEGWRVKKNGSIFWANVVLTALYNDTNQLIGFSKVTRDLTERVKNEEILRQSEERYRSLVEQVTDYGIFMMDDKGRIISWNEGAKRLKGYSADDIIGKYFSIFYTQEDILNDKPANELKIARAEGKYEEEGWRLKKDGSRFWANVVITAVYNSNKKLVGFSKVTRDLTEKKEREQVLKTSHENYRQLAHELQITNAELLYANEELEQFTSIVSHDLQEPVRTIKSFLILMDMKLEEGQIGDLQTYVGKSVRAANKMKELIENLLQYAQLSKGELKKDKLTVNDLVNQAMQNLKASIETSGAKIIIENEVESIYGDGTQLVQLIQNLLSNALKFTDAEIPLIRIRCKRENGYVKFAISDNGIGIAGDSLNKVFDIFRRLHTTKEYNGTGIGLAICKKVVDRHYGKIWTESEPGRGTTFYFTLSEAIKKNDQFYEKV